MHVELPNSMLRGIVDAASSIPRRGDSRWILRNLLIVASPAGLEIVAHDTLVGAWLMVPVGDDVRVEVPGRTAVNAFTLKDVVKASPKDITRMRLDKNHLRVETGGANFKLPTEDPNDFPPIPRFDPTKPSLRINAGLFGGMINRVAHCAHTEQSHFLMHGVNIDYADGCLTLVATNAQRLGVSSMNVGSKEASSGNCVVPAESFRRLSFFFDGEEDIDLQFLPTGLHAHSKTGEVQIRALSGKFPIYARGIPKNPLHLSIGRQRFIDALNQAVAIKQTGTAFVNMTLGERMTLEAREHGIGDVQIEVDIEWKHPEMTLCLHPLFLLEDARSMKSDCVTLEISSPMKPVLLREQMQNGMDCFYVYAVARR